MTVNEKVKRCGYCGSPFNLQELGDGFCVCKNCEKGIVEAEQEAIRQVAESRELSNQRSG